MRITKEQAHVLTLAQGDAVHIGTMLDDLRQGHGHPTDLDKIRKTMAHMLDYFTTFEELLPSRRTVPREGQNREDKNREGQNGELRL